MIFFDLDDTLFDEHTFCSSAYEEIAAYLSDRHGCDMTYIIAAMTDLLYRRENPFTWLDEELNRRGLNHEGYLKELISIYRNHAPEMLPGTRDMHHTLSLLKERGYNLGLITDGRSVTQRNKIRALGLEQYFDPEAILISEETGYDKTSPENFRKAMELDGDGEPMVYVGDNTAKDFRHPNLLGWHTFCLRHMRAGVHPQDFTLPYPVAPSYIISSLPELLLYFPAPSRHS